MLKTYHLRSLIVLMPAILINQLAMFFFLSLKGKAVDFIIGSLQVWKTLPLVLKKRKAVQRLKRVRDRAVLSGEPIDMLGAVETSLPVRAASGLLNAFFSVYWALTRWMIK